MLFANRAMPAVSEIAVTTSTRRPQLPALTGIRAFVSLDIVFFHFSNPRWFGPLAPLVDSGFIGVSFFFVLSGFILSYNYCDRPQKMKARQFWLTRFARLYPVYLLALVVSFRMLQAEWHAQTLAHFAEGMALTPLMLQGWSPLLATFWNTPGWTLSCEVAFYAMLPLLVAVRWPRALGRLLALLGLLWMAGLVLPLLYLWLRPDGIAHVDRYSYSLWLRALKFMPVPHVPEFLFGVVLARLHAALGKATRERLALTAVGLVATLGMMLAGSSLPFVLLHDGLLMPAFGILILGLAGEHVLAKPFGLAPVVLLGEASFCLYLLHFNLWELIHQYGLLTPLHLTQLDPWISYVLVISAALAAHRWVEVPGRRWILRQEWLKRLAEGKDTRLLAPRIP